MHKKPLELGQDAFQKRAWEDAFHHLSVADADYPLGSKLLELLAVAAYLTGKSSESKEIWARAHSVYLDEGNIEQAVYCAFQLGFALFHQGEYARGGGWFARAKTLLDDIPHNRVEKGYLMLPAALQYLQEEDA